jgi:hypothetical protein
MLKVLFTSAYYIYQSVDRQSTWIFLQSSELGPPTPSPAGEVAPSPLVPGGAYSLVGEGVGGVPTRTRGQTL